MKVISTLLQLRAKKLCNVFLPEISLCKSFGLTKTEYCGSELNSAGMCEKT